jgi:hypothetical protein
VIDGIDVGYWGVFTKCKREKNEENEGEKSGMRKKSPSRVRYSSERKREKSALLPKQRKTPFLSLKNEILILLFF